MRIDFNGIPLDLLEPEAIIGLIESWLRKPGGSHQVVTLNALMFMKAKENPDLKEAITKADLVLGDGYGVMAAVKRLGFSTPDRLPGIELTRVLLERCSALNKRVYFYGATAKTIGRLREIVPSKWPGITITGMRDGYSMDNLREGILKNRPDLLLVALGTPVQENFLNAVLKELPGTVGIGVGGSFDILARVKREALPFFRKHGWEWLFRMVQEPRRFRYLPKLIQFWLRYVL